MGVAADAGLPALVEAARDDAAPAEAEAQQPLPFDQLDNARAAGLPRVEARKAPRARGGRPPGALNRRTQQWADWLLRHKGFASPLEVLAQVYSRPVLELAAELGCTPLEALRVQINAAEALAPYLHGKMPGNELIKAGPVYAPQIQLTGDMEPALAAMLRAHGVTLGEIEALSEDANESDTD